MMLKTSEVLELVKNLLKTLIRQVLRLLLAVTRNLHPKHERNVSHVRHLEPLHQLQFNALDDLDVSSNEEKVIHVESQDDDDAVLPV